jgi:hypothetical protein
MWFVVAVGTIKRSATGKMFFAPCLGTDLYHKKTKEEKAASEHLEKAA